MSESQFTPGPWRSEWREDEAEHKIYGEKQPDGFSEIIAGCIIRRDNARLIAAAPDLLEAAKELVAAIWDGRLEQEGAEVFTDPMNMAIAKAEGR